MFKPNLICSLFIVICFFYVTTQAAILSPQTENIGVLEKGQIFEKQLHANEKHVYLVKIGTNQLVDLVVDQNGIDVVVSLINSGKTVFEIDSPNGNMGPELVYYVAEADGDYTLEVKSLEEKAKPGSYKVSFNQLRIGTEEDKQEIMARRFYLEGRILREQATVQALRESIEKYLQAFSIWDRLKNLNSQEECLVIIGQTYYALREYELALEHNEKGLKVVEKTNNKKQKAILLNNIGLIHYELGNFELAINFYNNALSLLEGDVDNVQKGATFYNIALLQSYLGNREKAIDYLKRSLEITTIQQSLFEQVRILNLISIENTHLGNYKQAIDNATAALSIAAKVKSSVLEIESLRQIANVYRDLGDKQKSLEYYYKALNMNKNIGDKVINATTNADIGLLYYYLNDIDKALEFYNLSLPVFISMDNKVALSSMYNNLALAYKSQRKFEKSFEYYSKALSISKETKKIGSELNILNNIAGTYLESNEIEKAEQIFNDVLQRSKGVEKFSENNSIIGLAQIYFIKGQYEKAREYCVNYMLSNSSIFTGYNPRQLQAFLLLAKINLKEKKYEDVVKCLNDGIFLCNNTSKTLSRDEFRISFLSTVQSFYEFAIDFYMQQKVDQTNYNIALEINERSKVQGLLYLINERALENGNNDYTNRKNELEHQINYLSEGLAQIFLNPKINNEEKLEKKREIKSKIDGLQVSLDLNRRELLEKNPQYYNLVEPKTLTSKEMQQVVDKNTLILEYFLGIEHSYLWVIAHDSIKTFVLPPKDKIETLVKDYIEIIQTLNNELGKNGGDRLNKQEHYKQLSETLSQMLLAPAIKELGAKRLVIIPDKTLYFLPFATLAEPTYIGTTNNTRQSIKNITPLILNHEIAYLSSISLLYILRKEKVNREIVEPSVAIAIFADPVFEQNDLRVAKKEIKNDRNSEQVAELKSDIETALRDSGNISRLPYTRQEAENIKNVFTSSQFRVQLLLDFDCNRQNAINGNLEKALMIHFSTHGFINSKKPELSGLVFSLVDENGNIKPGVLTVNEIFSLKLNAKLVTLSACKTAVGKTIAGEGIVGLTRAFFYAGAERVMGSLWSVNDRATSELMTRFYTNLIKDKITPIAALRQAQISMLRDERLESPFYWAAFQIYGDYN